MTVELYIEGHKIDLGKIRITQVYQINDIGEPKDRQLNYSFPFDIPMTSHNVKVLDYLGVVGNVSRTAYKNLKGKLVQNSIEIIPDGTVIISKKAKGKFKAHIYGGNSYLFEKIGSKKVKELNFAEVNHEVNESNFVNSFANNEGYIYAISDFGKISSENNKIEINYQVPSLYVHSLWDKIFKEAGVSYYGNIFNTEKFKKLLFTMRRGYNAEIEHASIPVNEEYKHGIQDYYHGWDNGIGYNVYQTMDTISMASYENDNLNGFTLPFLAFYRGIKYVSKGLYKISFSVNLKLNDNKGNKVKLKSVKYKIFQVEDVLKPEMLSVPLSSKKIKEGTILSNEVYNSFSFDFNEEVILTAPDLNKAYYCNVYLYYTTEIVTYKNDFPKFTEEIHNYSFKNKANFSTMAFDTFIGDLTQISFVKDIMQHFGLVFQKRRNELAYDFMQIKDLLKDRSNTIDWSDKFINEIDVNYKLNKYAQSNIFAYNYLEKEATPFADGYLNIDNETLPTQKTLVTRPYNAPTKSDNKILDNKILYTPFWKAERDEEGKITKYKPFSSKNYLCELKKENGTISYGITTKEFKEYTGDIPFLDFSNLSYGQLLNENYKEIKKVLDFNFVINAKMLLNELDIQNLDLFKTVYLEQYGADFYINKIRFTDSSKTSIVELVKIKR